MCSDVTVGELRSCDLAFRRPSTFVIVTLRDGHPGVMPPGRIREGLAFQGA